METYLRTRQPTHYVSNNILITRVGTAAGVGRAFSRVSVCLFVRALTRKRHGLSYQHQTWYTYEYSATKVFEYLRVLDIMFYKKITPFRGC